MSVDSEDVRQSRMRRRVRLLQGITIIWLLVESSISLFAAYGSDNLSFIAFGDSSVLELCPRLLLSFTRSEVVTHEGASKHL